MAIYTYIASGVGADETLGYFFFFSLMFSPTAHFLQDFSFK